MYFCDMSFDVLKALHIIFFVSWFAGLFYMVRLFIYHTEAQNKKEIEKTTLSNQFIIMEKKLWWVITTPAMILTVIFGSWMIALDLDYYLTQGWMHIKLTFVVFLLGYHFYTQKMMFQIAKNQFTYSSTQLRLWNELATFFLVSIVFIVVLKSNINWIYGIVGFFSFGIMLMLAVKIINRIRT
ncbi:MAG: CopD family protein [Crocinitomicaceae bacterium]